MVLNILAKSTCWHNYLFILVFYSDIMPNDRIGIIKIWGGPTGGSVGSAAPPPNFKIFLLQSTAMPLPKINKLCHATLAC